MGQGATWEGKPAQTASQGQTAGNRQGGPLGPPAVCLHRHFRPVILESFFGSQIGDILCLECGPHLLQF